jgi:hypothetical protein
MARDPQEEPDGGLLRDKYGRLELVFVDRHSPPSLNDIPAAGTTLDQYGRQQVVAVRGDGSPYVPASQDASGSVQGPAGPEGPIGPRGDPGPAGPAGPPGAGITLRSSVANSSLLPATGNVPGDARFTEDTGHLWVYDANGWADRGNLQGPAGPTGLQGPQGAQGPQGVPGATGATGPAGPTGATGPTGPAGVGSSTVVVSQADPPSSLAPGTIYYKVDNVNGNPPQVLDVWVTAGVTPTSTTATESGLALPYKRPGVAALGPGTKRWYNIYNYPLAIRWVAFYAETAGPVGTDIIGDVNINGSTAFTTSAHQPRLPAGTWKGAQAVPDVTTIPIDGYLTVDFDQIGAEGGEGTDIVLVIRMVPA